ncbi:DNA mismatch repair protein MSH3 isoform X2 [Telopea speciosissima]|uniref:DNA mismatch repair protein MSH3 isoform X2 n=1 Tax=Telopea speciosissima TaxID=54955 RepID=UPI001CC4BD29|nr:DNA mismatch repair protein MSH3 isoform X2 [Telopea speciosissima]
MGKQKQQFISRFFAPKPKNASSPSSSSPSVPSPNPNPPTPPPKVSATVSFSPAKRIRSSKLASPKNLTNSQLQNPSKKPKLSPHTQNPIPPLPNPSLHQKFIQKLLEPSTSSPQTAKPPPPNLKYTPLEQQVVDLKAKYPDVLLMIEVGYKYRFFGEDAEIAARVLGIYAHVDHNFLTASIPTFRLNVHVRRLVSVGYKVGVVKQTETAAIKAHGTNRLGPFCRGLSALYTKATIEAAEDVGGGEEGCGSSSNYLLCVVEKGVLVENEDCGVESGFDVRIGLIAVEISTGDVVHGEFNDNVMRSGLESVVLSLSPAEILIGDPLSRQTEKLLLAYAGPASNVRVERASRNCFCDGGALAEVMSLYEKTGDDATVDYQEQNSDATERENNWLGIEGIISMPELAVQALALTIRHLKQFGLERILCLGASFRPFSTNMEMSLSANALQQLEVLKNNSDGSETGSLLQLMNHTLTIFGSRLLRHWFVSVMHAILDAGKQFQQLNIEEEDYNGRVEEQAVHSALLRRLILTVSSSTVIGHAAKLLAVLNKDAADQGDLENLFNVSNGQFPEVTRAQTSFQIAKEKLDLLIGLYRKQLGMHNLEFMSVSGSTHLVELPSNVKVPLNWIKVNSTKKTVRYHPPEVLTALDRLSLAKEELAVACRAAWDSFLMGFGKYYPEFQAAVQALAALDCLHSLAILSRNKNYVCPTFVDDDEPVQIHIRSGRHPVLEAILQDNFVPNDTDLHADREYCQIVTGPNMGGKSCYIRQVALIAIMAQVGSFVPASSVKLHVLDGIYTRMGASDNIQQGRSTFLEELSEASYIFHNCTSRSLVIIDELGRGTSTHDGIAIAYAILHHLVAQKRCMVLFVTHYPKIVDIKDEFPGSVGSCHVSYLTSQKTVEIADSKSDQNVEDLDQGNLTFLYKVVPGTSDKSFGLNVARLAQLPYLCISRAAVMAAKLEEVVSTRMAHKLLLGTPSVHEELVAHENFFASNYCSNGNGFSACSSMDGMEGLEELADLYHKFFIELKSAVAEVASENCYQSLKRARIIALSILNR